MITTINLILILSIMILLSSANPVKMSMNILLFSMLIFLKLIITTGSTWLYSILLMLFMGGILILFMIISSLMPNVKSDSIKIEKMILVVSVLMIMMSMESSEMESLTLLKWSLTSKSLILSVMSVLGLYFFSFLQLLSLSKTPLRSYTC